MDVSHWQGSSGIAQAAWEQMFAEGKRFAFVKATEGLTGPDDPAMAANVARATAAGLLVGVYHYAHPENRPTPAGAVQEADHLLSYAGNFVGPGYLRPVLDVEGAAASLGTAELTDWVLAFCERVVALRGPGARPIIYTTQSFANNEFDSRLAAYDLWLRTITALDPATNQPPGQGFADPTGVFDNWAFWQYSDTGSAGGISPIDLNVCHTEFKPLVSHVIPPVEPPVPPILLTQPESQTVAVGSGAAFAVSISLTSSPPISYQWRFHGTNLPGATLSTYTRANAQPEHAGPYDVVVSNPGGSVTSAVAMLTVFAPVTLYEENFDGFPSPSLVTTPGTTNGFGIFFHASSGPVDFIAGFGVDYSSLANPVPIPPAPGSQPGGTRGLYLTVNKDGVGAAAAVNLYPAGRTFSGNFALRFDLWINWISGAGSTEHALFGINHSATIPNRIGVAPSDGLFFGVDGDGGVSAVSAVLRDYSIFRGGGTGPPILMHAGNTVFGPAPLLGQQFDHNNPGFTALFPSQVVPGFTTPAGSAGLRWVRVEVRQQNRLVTWLLNDAIVAQFTNTFAFTNGHIMIGYNDHFDSIGNPANFALIDNLRVQSVDPDYDANGLPDEWELRYFGHLGVRPDTDADGDGASNGHEYQAGTNPTNAASVFRIVQVTRTGHDVRLEWSTVGGRRYVVQTLADTNANLPAAFADVSPVISIGGTNEGTTSYLHAGGATNPAGYYRIRLVP
ncbi:MAG: GH25 family lysozyme [Verrucomicrobiales bacterium]|nr:GH25 family lysozyme [Verrucomicrobiales bacterium]